MHAATSRDTRRVQPKKAPAMVSAGIDEEPPDERGPKPRSGDSVLLAVPFRATKDGDSDEESCAEELVDGLAPGLSVAVGVGVCVERAELAAGAGGGAGRVADRLIHVGVALDVCDSDGVRVAENDTVLEKLGVGVRLEESDTVGDTLGVSVLVAVTLGEDDTVDDTLGDAVVVDDTLRVALPVGDTELVAVRLAEPDTVGEGVELPVGVAVADAVALGVKQPEDEMLPERVPLPEGVTLPVPVTVLDEVTVENDDALPDTDIDGLRVDALLAEARCEPATEASAVEVDTSVGAVDGDAPTESNVALATGDGEKSALGDTCADAAGVCQGVSDDAPLGLAEAFELESAEVEAVVAMDTLGVIDARMLDDGTRLAEERCVPSIE